jgi:hypothetical protein
LGTYYRAGGAEMTDTPETDDLARGNHVVPTEFAEQLERERDDLIASLNFHADLNKELIRERDEAIRSCYIWQKGHAESVARMYDIERKLKKITEALEYIIGIGLTEKTKAKAEKALQITQSNE